MQTVYIKLAHQKSVERFVGILDGLQGQFRLLEDTRTADARSPLAIFCLNLSRPLLLEIDSPDPECLAKLKEFIIE